MTDYPNRLNIEDHHINEMDRETIEKAVFSGLARIECPECENIQYIAKRQGTNCRFNCEKCEWSGTVPF